MRARLCRKHLKRKCLPPRPATRSLVCNGAAIKLALMIAAALRCEAEADPKCVLVSVSGT